MHTENHLKQLDEFEAHYNYDTGYMKALLASSPAGFEVFNNFLPMAHFRETLSLEDYWVAKIAVVHAEDCGACLQLNIAMAKEQGVASSIIAAVLAAGDDLPELLNLVRQYAVQLSSVAGVDEVTLSGMRAQYSEGQLLEFGLAAASARVFPTIKRAIGASQHCTIPLSDAG